LMNISAYRADYLPLLGQLINQMKLPQRNKTKQYTISIQAAFDLKQIMFGTATSSDGIPILGEVMSGNTSDMKFNNGWIKKVRQALQKSDDDFLLYTADSAAVTEDNLKLFKEYYVDMISRLPERYGLAEELINQAIMDGNWMEIGTLGEGKKAAAYKSIGFEREL